MMPIIHTIVEQHAEEAAFLWLLRDVSIKAPHYTLKDIAELDERVEAHIDGLRIAGDAGWDICKAYLQYEESGEIFAATVLALESGVYERMTDILAVVDRVPETVRGLISAFGWVDPGSLQGTVKTFLDSGSTLLRYIGIAACAIHRVDPGKYLTASLASDNTVLQARSLKAVGELKRNDLRSVVCENLTNQAESCRFWAAWSGALLGESNSVDVLLRFVGTDSPFNSHALQLVLRSMSTEGAQQFLKQFAQGPENIRDLIVGCGIVGHTSYIPWLIETMSNPQLARSAGESFSMMTGVDIAYEDLEGEMPEGFEAGPTDNPEDEVVAVDPDEDLPWPSPERIQRWWEVNKHQFRSGERYLCGKPITVQHCRHITRTGYQRQRNAAALELALLSKEEALFETRAPGFRQMKMLEQPGALAGQ